MLSVVCWKWRPITEYPVLYTAEHVNRLYNMVQRHLKTPHKFICVTDDPAGLSSGITPVQLWADYAEIKQVNAGKPSCYRRLRAFASDAAAILGERFVSIDLDCVIVNDITPLFNRAEDFVICAGGAENTYYNGALWMLTAGSKVKVWEDFHEFVPELTHELRLIGSDQAWLSYILGPGEATWTPDDGIYNFKRHIQHRDQRLPDNARIVFFNGLETKPWMPHIQKHNPWIKEHWL